MLTHSGDPRVGRGHPIDQRTCLTGTGEKMELRHCVDAARQAMRSD